MELCKICGSVIKREEVFFEKMFGTQEAFTYCFCENCMTYQLKTVPQQLGYYYKEIGGNSYYSLSENRDTLKFKVRDVLLHYASLLPNRNKNILYKSTLSSKFIYNISRNDRAFNAISEIPGFTKTSAVLDVGCGTGWLIKKLSNLGFKNLTGIDLFIDCKDEVNTEKLKIVKTDIFDISDKYDLIMFHHSLEHMPDPASVINKASQLLNKDGTIIIRVPIISSFAFKKYGIDWVNFDAPRHLFNFSLSSLEYIADSAHLKINKVKYDSEEFQFWGSELYRNHYTLSEKNKEQKYTLLGITDNGKQLRKTSKKLNSEKQGDSVAVYLYK